MLFVHVQLSTNKMAGRKRSTCTANDAGPSKKPSKHHAGVKGHVREMEARVRAKPPNTDLAPLQSQLQQAPRGLSLMHNVP